MYLNTDTKNLDPIFQPKPKCSHPIPGFPKRNVKREDRVGPKKKKKARG